MYSCSIKWVFHETMANKALQKNNDMVQKYIIQRVWTLSEITCGDFLYIESSHGVAWLKGPSRKLGSKCCTFSYFFYWRKFILKVWLITCLKIMSLRAREPPQNRGYVRIIGIHMFISSKLWGRFSQLFVFF